MREGGTVIRPARRQDSAQVTAFLAAAPRAPGSAEGAASIYVTDIRYRVLAWSGGRLIGSCLFIPGAGRCAAVLPPRLLEWDETLAARLYRATAAQAYRLHKARLIQSLTPPDARGPLSPVLRQAGFEELALLSYMRRPVRPEDFHLEPPRPLEWATYSRLRHRRFANTLCRTYDDSQDCPRLVGLRSVHDTIATHRYTGRFTPRAWRLCGENRRPLGVVLVNDMQGRGELVYLGVVADARRKGLGTILLNQAIRDTARMGLPQMGLAVDVANTPAVRLYDRAGFTEVRRRMTYFIPGDRLATLAE